MLYFNQYQLQDVDAESRALIEQMLAEEEFYYGSHSISTISASRNNENHKKKAASSKSKKKRKSNKPDIDIYPTDESDSGGSFSQLKKSTKKGETSLSSAALPSHKTRWTTEEDNLLHKALEKYGYGNWKKISEHMKTRNPLQCKNHARHWVLSEKLKKPSTVAVKEQEDVHGSEADDTDISKMDTLMTEKEAETEAAAEAEIETKAEIDEDILVEDETHDIVMNEPTLPIIEEEIVPNDTPVDQQDSLRAMSIDEDEISTSFAVDPLQKNENKNSKIEETVSMFKETPLPQETPTAVTEKPVLHKEEKQMTEKLLEKDQPKAPVATETVQTSSLDLLATPAIVTVPEIKTCTDESIYMNFDKNNVSEEEKASNPEWFNNKQSKTSDRYLKIRNHMLYCWRQCQPRYLTKTSARRDLRDCGDVNAIGRVHSYLESVGAININCVTNAPRPPKRIAYETYEDEDGFLDTADLVVGYDGPRKRKVRNYVGEWVDPRELEGRVIEHGTEVHTENTPRPKRIVKQTQQYYSGDDFGRGYDPFRLIPVEYYTDNDSAPFTVEIISNALLVMDFHSHLAHTEIIGLLGGNFVDNGGTKVLKVESVFPCQSTSTGIQCEMDPASEMKAREVFAEKGYTVVGWYHSHPTFDPHPSIRDIENQTSYQTLFRNEKTGDEPFIGVIVNPYDAENTSDHSQIQYLHISNCWNRSRSFRLPFACRRSVRQSEQVSSEVYMLFKELVDEFKDYEHKMDMLRPFGSQTRLNKLLDSLRANIFLSKKEEDKFLSTVHDLMVNVFQGTPKKS
ncbi:hypothetical protein BDF14DRAFT_1843235 [Spinellus fusiger]|nr:hypothetical protein BDF14DRAFT_1843235 [Spinellus fusiger]